MVLVTASVFWGCLLPGEMPKSSHSCNLLLLGTWRPGAFRSLVLCVLLRQMEL